MRAVSPWREDLGLGDHCLTCGGIGVLRPHVVWFGEMPLEMDEIYAALRKADLFVAIGTSGSVYPAAGFVSEARVLDIRTCEINLEPSDNANQFDERRYGPASEMVSAWWTSPCFDVNDDRAAFHQNRHRLDFRAGRGGLRRRRRRPDAAPLSCRALQ